MYSDERMYGDAISNALLLLDKLGASIDPNQTIEASTILQTKSLFEESMEDMREIEDEKILSIMRVLHEIGYSCWFSGNLNLVALVAVKMIELVFKYGLSKYAPYAVASFAVLLVENGDKSSYDFGKIALNLLKKSKAKEMTPIIHVIFYYLINPFFASVQSSLDPLRITASTSLEIGSHHYSKTCIGSYSCLAFFCGEKLSNAIDKISQFEDKNKDLQQQCPV